MAKKEIYFDVRVSGRYINDGIITQKEYDDHIKKLKDVADEAEKIVIDDEDEDSEEQQSTEGSEQEQD